MINYSRRLFLKGGITGLAMVFGGELILQSDAAPTESSGKYTDYFAYFEKDQTNNTKSENEWAPTEDNILGPFYREGSPFRAKISPPIADGTVLLISGRVWGYDTRKPLRNAVIDVWHADKHGKYDVNYLVAPDQKVTYVNRARLITDENGYYEYETIHPGAYQLSPGIWRPNHIHYLVRHPEYKDLITQLFFTGDPHQETDRFIRNSLIIDLDRVPVGNTHYEKGVFDIVLERRN